MTETAQIAAASEPRKRPRKHLLLQWAEYSVYRFVAAAVRSVSEERLQRWGTRFGGLGGRILRGRDRLALRNLRASFPEKSERECRAILDECWRHFGRETLL